MLIIYSKFGKFRNLPYICIIKVKQVVTIKKCKIMKTEKIYIIEFRNSEGKRGMPLHIEQQLSIRHSKQPVSIVKQDVLN